MRSYDPTDKYDIEEAARLGVKPWQLDLLKLNPDYTCWGPHEDYMCNENGGWAAPAFCESWADFSFGLNDLNECVNFYFQLNRDSKTCPTCGGTCYHPDAQWVTESFYGHSTPFRAPAYEERRAKAVMDQFGTSDVATVVSGYPTEEVLAKYNPAFRQFCEEMLDCDGSWRERITEEEVEALWKESRLRDFKTKPTAQQVNSSQNQRGTFGHDCINRHILIRTRLTRFGMPVECEECEGHGSVFTAPEPHVTLVLWMLHPRKGCSRGVEVKKLDQDEVPKAVEYLKQAAQRNADRFGKL